MPFPLTIAAGNFFFRFRNALFPLIMVALLIWTRPHPVLGMNEGVGFVWIGAGVLLALMGEIVRLGTIGYRYIERGGRGGKVYASKLVTEGIFRHVRNPMYVGNIFIVIGLAMMTGSLGAFLFTAPFFLYVYHAITCAEENYLRGSFAEGYIAYCQDVPRFIPNFKGLGETLSSMKFEWRRALRKDYGTMMTIALTAIVLPLWRTYFLEGAEAADNNLGMALLYLGVAVLLYLGAMTLKKTGVLADRAQVPSTSATQTH